MLNCVSGDDASTAVRGVLLYVAKMSDSPAMEMARDERMIAFVRKPADLLRRRRTPFGWAQGGSDLVIAQVDWPDRPTGRRAEVTVVAVGHRGG